jgi:hypothetical protein
VSAPRTNLAGCGHCALCSKPNQCGLYSHQRQLPRLHDCWWFARTVGLTLELLASKIPLPSVSDAEAADATTSAAAASAAATAAIAADLTSNAPAPTNTPVRTPPAPPATPEAAEVEEDFLRRSQQPLTTRLGDREISADVAHILTTFVSQVGVAFVFTL